MNQNSTIVFPLPIDLLKPFEGPLERRPSNGDHRRPAPAPPQGSERHLRSGSTSSPGCASILAPGRAERPDAFAPAQPRRSRGRPRVVPLLRGPRGPHAAGGVGATAPAGGAPDSPGWTRARGAEPLSGARGRRGRGGRRAPAEAATPACRARWIRCAPRPARGAPRPVRSQPARGAHEVIVHGPEHATRWPSSAASASPRRSPRGASGCAPMPTPSYVPPDRQRGLAMPGLARAHPRPALRARVRPGRRSPASASASAPTTSARWAATCSRTSPRRRCAARAARRRRRRRAAGLPVGLAIAVRAAGVPRRPAPRFEPTTSAGAAMIRRRSRALGGALRRAAAAQPLGSHRARGTRGVLLARRHPSAADVRAGFELGTGVDVNVYPPERAAADLRDALGA